MDDSPIEQVRLTVPPTDEKTLQALTFRTWAIGIPICAIASVFSSLSDFRQQILYLSPICINIIVLILGKLMANSFPNKVVRVPCTKWGFSLNPGPFNLKEHVVTNMLANSATYPFGFDIVSISKIFYHKDIPWLPAMLLVLSIQFLGFGFAGIFIKLLVDSPYMWWPSNSSRRLLLQVSDVPFFLILIDLYSAKRCKRRKEFVFVFVFVVLFFLSCMQSVT
ncbi:hypothetical protein B296_00023976 [Ensete ventricosum]|uniref:Uncharacterized protein n=1 Tax=Ensete ventricosum TaxID=4639 RepID=A0A426YH88_ENSVE|nr:hypothetical protein B296_00023976 [Ensete ventricosum]